MFFSTNLVYIVAIFMVIQTLPIGTGRCPFSLDPQLNLTQLIIADPQLNLTQLIIAVQFFSLDPQLHLLTQLISN